MFVNCFLFLLNLAWAYDEHDVHVPSGYRWICDTFSKTNKGEHFIVSKNGTYAVSNSGHGMIIQGETPLMKNHPDGDNKYFIPVHMSLHENSFFEIGLTQHVSSFTSVSKDEYFLEGSSIFKDVNSNFYTIDSFSQQGTDFGELNLGDLFYLMLDMDEGKVSFEIDGQSLQVFEVDDMRFTTGTWYFSMWTQKADRGATLLHDPNGCHGDDTDEKEMEVPRFTSGLFENLISKFGLSEETAQQLKKAAAQDEFDIEKVLMQAAMANPQRLQALSQTLGENSEVTEDDVLSSILDIAMTPMVPSGLCNSDIKIQTLLENKKLEIMSQLFQLAITRNITTDGPIQEALSASIFIALMAYPLEDESLKNDYHASMRDTVYAKLNEMRGYLKKAPLPEFQRIVGSSFYSNSDTTLDLIIQEILLGMSESVNRIRDSPLKQDELEQIALLETKYADIWI